MKFYVAARFSQKDLVLETYGKLKKLDHSVAYDWTTHKPIKPYDQNPQTAQEYCRNEIKGISECDAFIYFADEKGTTLPMEFGAALMLAATKAKPLIYAVGEFNNKSPWFFNPRVSRMKSIDDVFGEIKNLSCKANF